jgi:hypothetical protein
MCTGRVRDDVCPLYAECGKDGGQILAVDIGRRVRQAVFARYVGKMVLPAIGNDAMLFRKRRQVRIPLNDSPEAHHARK